MTHDTTARWLTGDVSSSSSSIYAHLWRRRAFCFAALLASLWSAPARAESLAARLSVKKGAEVQIAALKDGFHVGIMVESADPHSLAEALTGLQARTVDVQPVGQERVLATVRFAQPVTSARAVLVREAKAQRKQAPASPAADANAAAANDTKALASANGNDANALTPPKVPEAGHVRVDVLVTLSEPREAVALHALAQRLPLPETLAHHRLWDAEEALVAGRLAEAQLIFEGLNTQGPLVGWAMLRLGDLAANNGMETLACQHYQHAGAISDVRVPSTLAGMRSRVLGCPNAPAVDYTGMLSRIGRDDPVGRNLANEARWALGFERDVESLDAVASLGKRGAIVPADMYDVVAARRLRLRDPMQRVLADMRVPIEEKQVEALDLSLSVGQALCALDVPERWRAPRVEGHKWWSASSAVTKRVIAAVKHCEGLDHPKHAAAVSRAKAPDVIGDMRDIEARVSTAKRVAQHRYGMRGTNRVMSNAPKGAAPTPNKTTP